MEIYIFGLGVFVICLVIASVFFVNHEETKKYNDIDESNEMDYDGMGNYGRFPNNPYEKKSNGVVLKEKTKRRKKQRNRKYNNYKDKQENVN